MVPSPGRLEHLTTDETAALLRVSRRTVQRYIAGGKLRAARLPGRLLVTRESIEELLNNGAQPSAGEG